MIDVDVCTCTCALTDIIHCDHNDCAPNFDASSPDRSILTAREHRPPGVVSGVSINSIADLVCMPPYSYGC